MKKLLEVKETIAEVYKECRRISGRWYWKN